jgi:hypothetical protein
MDIDTTGGTIPGQQLQLRTQLTRRITELELE